MRGFRRPLLVGGAIVVCVFLLAKAQVFEPTVAKPAGTGDVQAGRIVFEGRCAGCHGSGGRGGGAGPRLVGSGLTASRVSAQVERGGGVMPAGLASGKDEADVVAYVVSIAKP